MKNKNVIIALDYKLQQIVADYIRLKAVYEELMSEVNKMRKNIENFVFESGSPLEIMRRVEYMKLNLYEIEKIELELNKTRQELEDLRENIKLLNATKKAVEKYLDEKIKKENKKQQLKELNLAEEIYRNKLANIE